MRIRAARRLGSFPVWSNMRVDQPRCEECQDSTWLIETWFDRSEQDTPLHTWVLNAMPAERRQRLLDAAGGDPSKVRLWKAGLGKPMSQARRCLCVGLRRTGEGA